jgi:hypothetical protein
VTDYVSSAAAAAGGARRNSATSGVARGLAAEGVERDTNGGANEQDSTACCAEAVGSGTLTLTPTLWSLLNVIIGGDVQRPHRHQSVAVDLCVWAPEGDGVYTLMGPKLDPVTGLPTGSPQSQGAVKCVWRTGACFTTPPGWWHSHHNETGEAAWVLPMQDAGLFTYQRTLDIQFS